MAGVYGAPVASVQEAAAALAVHCEGASSDDLATFLRHLGGMGPGLFNMLQQELAVGPLFRVLYNLNMLTEMAVVNQHTCQRLCMLGFDVLALLDNAGSRGVVMRPIGLQALTACFEDICRFVDAFTQPGWLMVLACDTRRRDGYETLHQAVLELVKGEGLLAVAGARPPLNPDYRDLGRPLRRMLKQMGSGSLTAGVQQLHVDDKCCVEVARLLEVPLSTVKAEVDSLPRSDLELKNLYNQLLQSTGSSSSTPVRVSECAAYNSPSTRRGSTRTSHADTDTPAAGGAAGGAAGSGSAALSMDSPAAAALFEDLFKWYDRNKSGALEQQELQAALADLGMLDGKSDTEAQEITEGYMRMADATAHAQGEGVAFEAFCRLYETLVLAQARQQLRFKLGLQAEGDLRTTFLTFAAFGSREAVSDMGSAHFLKLCRDCGLLDKQTGPADADLIFASVKAKGARKITFDEFLTALLKLAERKAVPFESLVMDILRAQGPVAHTNVQPEFVRLHDDKSTFTGVYARGGPSQVDPVGFDLSQLVDRSLPESARRGAVSPSSLGSGAHPSRRISLRSIGGLPSGRGSSTRRLTPLTSQSLSGSNSMGTTTPFASLSGLAAAGQQQMATPHSGPQATSARAGRRASNSTAAPKEPAGRPAAAAGSAAAPAGTASSKRRSVGTAAGIGACRSPAVAAAGGHGQKDQSSQRLAASIAPSSSSRGAACTSGSLSPDRAAAAAAVATPAEGADAAATRSSSSPAVTPPLSASGDAVGSAGKSGAAAAGALTSSLGAARLQDVFAAFAAFGIRSPIMAHKHLGSAGCDVGQGRQQGQAEGSPAVQKQLLLEMDGFRFVKLCREAGLLDGDFTTTSADIIFAKVKAKGAKKITYAQFMTALSMVAAAKKAALQDVADMIARCGGPAYNSSVTPDSVRVHDSR